MVSDSAKRSLEQIFVRSVSAHLGMADGDQVQVEALTGHRGETIEEKQFYILTIANFFFKVLVIFHTQPDEKTSVYFSRPESGQISGQSVGQTAGGLGFSEVFPELCNLCCGAMNRELGRYFHHLGMSTPDCLNRECLVFLDLLRPAYRQSFRIVINEDVRLHATLCVCAYQALDFRWDAPCPSADHSAPETGVLELF